MSDYKALVSKMTIQEKASLLSGEDFWRSRSVERLDIPQMMMADGPHGLRKQRTEGDHLGLVEGVEATCFPTSATMANSWDLELCEKVGAALGKEAAHHEVNIILGPGLNIKRSPLCGRNFEYFSEDPYLSGKMAAAYVKGIQSEGVGACLKHFAANSQEYLRMTNDSIVDDRTLHELYLTGFEIAVKESKPKAVMSAYNKINGTYANENRYLLQEVLRDQWGFDGMVVSDWGGSNDHVDGVRAGAHMEMPTTGTDSYYQLVEAIESGMIDEKIVDQRVEEYLKVLYETQIHDSREVDYNAHHQLAREAAEAAVILLKNDNTLPINGNEKVAIIGDFAQTPRYQGAGSSMVNPYQLDNALDKIKVSGVNYIGYAQGFDRNGKKNEAMKKEAIELAKKADKIILFVGLNEVNEVEGHDRSHMKLPMNQVEFIEELSKVSGKLAVVISSGSAIEMPWEKHCDGILHTYLSGQSGAGAIANVLTGKVNPSGKLTESYPIQYEDCPNVRYYPGRESTSEYREGMYVGYRYYDKANIEVKYPFGYGLSYTTFEYSNLIVDKDCVKFSITNTGKVAGAEVAQLYIHRDQELIYRPEKELKGFKKVYLEPSETKEVTIPFDSYTFRYYDVNQKKFMVQKGPYIVCVGSSSVTIHLSETIDIDGVVIEKDETKDLKKYFDGNVADINSDEFERLYRKPLPAANWDRSQLLGINDSLSQMVYAKNIFARTVIKILISLRNRSYKKGKPDLNLFFLTNMPFRAIGKMSDGIFSMAMVENLLVIVNGHFFKGMSGLIKAKKVNKKRGKRL